MQFDSTLPHVDPFTAIFRTTDLSKGVQKHVSKVYQTLLVLIATAAVGAVLQVQYAIGGLITIIGTFASIFWFAVNPYRPNDAAVETKRTLIACLVAFFVGASIGPGLGYVYETQGDGIIAGAFLATAAMFACFSVGAMMSPRRYVVYSSSLIMTASMTLLVVSLCSWFYRFEFAEAAITYLGIILFSGYIIYDTQIMILQAEQGYKDVPNHAIQLFLDFVNLFVRILRLLSQKKQKDNNRRQN